MTLLQNPEGTSSTLPEAPHNCPGTESENAGREEPCRGCPNQGICASLPRGPDPDVADVRKNLERVRFKLLVLSGKGGVGKSTFSTQLAYWLARVDDRMVGLLDMDICGPSIPTMTGTESYSLHSSSEGIIPVHIQDNLAVVSVGHLLEHPQSAVIWRGAKKTHLLKEFLKNVSWESLDVLIVDTPPGTSDEHLSLRHYLDDQTVGAILVTTPQEISLQDVRKEIDFCRKVGMPILGVVENMAHVICPKCSKSSLLFDAEPSGGTLQMATEFGLSFLGSLPLDPRIGMVSDNGGSFAENVRPETRLAFENIAGNLIQNIRSMFGMDI